MTLPRNIDKRVHSLACDLGKNLANFNGPVEALLHLVIEKCGNCPTHFHCGKLFLSILDINSDKIVEALMTVFMKCNELNSWVIDLRNHPEPEPERVLITWKKEDTK